MGQSSHGAERGLRLDVAQVAAIDAELDAVSVDLGLAPGTVSANGVAVAGQDGWLFIADGANRWERQYRGEVETDAAWLAGWRDLFATRRAVATARGVGLLNLIVPEKQVILPDRRWPEAPDGAARPFRRLQAALPAEDQPLYPEAALRGCAAPSYFRRNSHWTASGCCAAVGAALPGLGVDGGLDGVTLAATRAPTAHDLTAHFFDPPPEEEALLLTPPGQVLFDNDHLATTGRHAGSLYVLANPQARDPRRLILFGDSYAYDAGLAYALSAVFAVVVFAWSKAVVWDLVTQYRAELVLWESAERFLLDIPTA